MNNHPVDPSNLQLQCPTDIVNPHHTLQSRISLLGLSGAQSSQAGLDLLLKEIWVCDVDEGRVRADDTSTILRRWLFSVSGGGGIHL